MIPLLVLLLDAAAAPASPQARFDACAKLVQSDPAKAEQEADAWRVAGGGLPARQCLGLAYVAQERWAPAAIAFEQAAQEAELTRDGRAATLWVQSANAALAGDDPARARSALDHALALPVLAGPLRGEALLDRARANVAAGDLTSARGDLNQALELVPKDPMAWLLSATLARRQGDAARAAKDIAQATSLAGPDDPDIKAEQQRIAAMGAPASGPR